MRTVFFGSPAFAGRVLLDLAEKGHNIAAVYTQPDRKKGRGGALAMPPVKEAALKLGIPVFQPEDINNPAAEKEIASFMPEVLTVVAYGRIFKEPLLKIAPYGAVNLHASLLPAYRGAAPVHRAVMNGETKTGVTTMFMDRGMDTGNMIFADEIPILPGDDTGSVLEKLSAIGAPLLHKTFSALAAGVAPSIPQDAALATYAPMIMPAHERIDWRRGADAIHNHIRGLSPAPGAFAVYGDKRLKLLKSAVWDRQPFSGGKRQGGVCLGIIRGEGVLVSTGDGALLIQEVQPEGKRRMPADDWARGARLTEGDSLG